MPSARKTADTGFRPSTQAARWIKAKTGDSVEESGYLLTVFAMDRLRIARVRVTSVGERGMESG